MIVGALMIALLSFALMIAFVSVSGEPDKRRLSAKSLLKPRPPQRFRVWPPN